MESISGNESGNFNFLDDVYFQKIGGQVNLKGQRDSVSVGAGDPVDILLKDGLESQDSFGRWMNAIMTDSPGSVDDPSVGSPVSSSHDTLVSRVGDHQQSSAQDKIFSITDFSPSWAFSTEKTKVFFPLLPLFTVALFIAAFFFLVDFARVNSAFLLAPSIL